MGSHGIDTMDIASIIKAVLTSGDEQPGRGTTELQPGDRLTGRVLRVEQDGKVLMDLGGSRALARLGFPVQAGQNLPLQVVENGAVLHLQVDPAKTGGKPAAALPTPNFDQALTPSDRDQLIGLVRQLIGRPTPTPPQHGLPDGVKDALVRMMSLFEPVPVEAAARDLSKWVKSAVEDRGLLLEKKLGEVVSESRPGTDPLSEKAMQHQLTRAIITRDVKSQLLMLRHYLQSPGEQAHVMEKLDAKSAAFLRHAVGQLLGHIEAQQELALPRWADGEAQQVFIHTLALQEQENPLKLKIYYPRREGRTGTKGPHRIALLLNMDHLGLLRVDLSMQDRMLQVVFYTAHQKALDLIGTEAKSVSDSLTGLFDHVAVDCFISRDKIADFDNEDVKRGGGGRIDLSV